MLASRCSAVTLGVSAGRYLRMSFTLTTRVSGIGLSEQSSHRPCTAPLALPAVSSQLGRSEEHTSELQSLMRISYAVFCLKKKKQTDQTIYQLICTIIITTTQSSNSQRSTK